jgi:hypothetical protein
MIAPWVVCLDPVTTCLLRPVVAVERDVPAVMVTLPAGATVEYEPGAIALGLAHVRWDGKSYSVNFQDLLGASFIANATRTDRGS